MPSSQRRGTTLASSSSGQEPAKENFRILSLDGGGIRGLFPAAFLAHIETHCNKRLIDYFDLLVGTSTGAIIALGLASGHTATEILAFYQEYGPRIFSKGNPLQETLQLIRPKYTNRQLVQALQHILGGARLNDLQVAVCIPSYELVEGIPRVFKDDHHPDLHWGGDQLLWKVAAASSAAPFYFPGFQIGAFDHHIDGGVWANNPIVVGISEAVRYFNRPLPAISALSVGTGAEAFRLPFTEGGNLGMLGWVRRKRIVNVVFGAQSQSAATIAAMLLGPERYTRVNADLPESIPLDNYQSAQVLIERGAQAGRIYRNQIHDLFLSVPRPQPGEPPREG